MYVLAEGLCPQDPISNYPLSQAVPAVGQVLDCTQPTIHVDSLRT